MKTIRTTAIAAALILGVASGAQAATDAKEPETRDWTFNGVFGYYDEAQLRRGFQVFKDICNACHGLDYIAYRNLQAIGYTEDEVKAIAAEFEVRSGPDEDGEELNEDGDFLTRPALPFDKFNNPYPNENAAKAANGGSLPPDLSLINKARIGGANYTAALLLGYPEEMPEDAHIPDDKHYNDYFPGNAIGMPQMLFDEVVEYEDETIPMTAEQYAVDVTAFLQWAAEPELEERKSLGVVVMVFLFVLTWLFYKVKQQVWRDVH